MSKENQEKNLTHSFYQDTRRSGILVSQTPTLSVHSIGAEINMSIPGREKMWGVVESVKGEVRVVLTYKTREEAIKAAVELNSHVIDSSFSVQEVVVSI